MQFSYSSSTAIPSGVIDALGFNLIPYITQVRGVLEAGDYRAPESSINLPGDQYVLTAVERVITALYNPALRYIFVVGIGGSNLGTKACYEAIAGARDLLPHTEPRLVFVDTTDTSLILACQKLILQAATPEACAIICISKSGNTTETILNSELLLATFRQRFQNRYDRVVVISDDRSPYLTASAALGMHTLALPPIVGGRYSVFSPVGLLPLGLLGLAPAEFRAGAVAELERCTNSNLSLNPAAQSALIQYYFYQQGMKIHDTFVFGSGLESLGKWYRQLLGESIGKSKGSGSGAERVGITPTVSVGSTDLHSVGQLYLGGPNVRVTTFVSYRPKQSALTLSTERVWPTIVPIVAGKSPSAVLAAIQEGTKAAYNTNRMPFMSVELESATPSELGAFMQFKMCEMMYLGHLMGVNPFDQPHVEQYKIVTKEILER
jgi:glucose-6-phosphate isomerase